MLIQKRDKNTEKQFDITFKTQHDFYGEQQEMMGGLQIASKKFEENK